MGFPWLDFSMIPTLRQLTEFKNGVKVLLLIVPNVLNLMFKSMLFVKM
jgi:hypothetical protein